MASLSSCVQSQLLKCLEAVMPEDIHERCNGVAHVSLLKPLTRVLQPPLPYLLAKGQEVCVNVCVRPGGAGQALQGFSDEGSSHTLALHCSSSLIWPID